MKTTTQIARETNLHYRRVDSVIRKERFVPARMNGTRRMFNEHQVEHIISILRFKYLIEQPIFHIYESKMNKKSFVDDYEKEKFNNFKKNTYEKSTII